MTGFGPNLKNARSEVEEHQSRAVVWAFQRRQRSTQESYGGRDVCRDNVDFVIVLLASWLCSFASLSGPLVEVHAIPACIWIFLHLKVVGR